MQQIIPHLWFDTNAEEAVNFYISVFGGESLVKTYYPEVGKEIHGMDAGTLLTASFKIRGYEMIALNGGPHFKFTPAISCMVSCSSIDEVNQLWAALIDGGKALMEVGEYPFSKRYGWVQDKYGFSWQLSHTETSGVPPIMPSLLYVGDVAGKAEEAINLYTSVFKDSSIGTIARYGAQMEPDKEGTVMYADFILSGQTFAAMDSAHKHDFTFTEAVSLMVVCKDQEEIDYYWEKLSAVPEAEQCGWIKDRYGVSWQIAPEGIDEMLRDSDKEKANKAMAAFLQMKKIDIAALKQATKG